MADRREDHDAEWEVLRLDGEAGPAKRILHERGHALVQAAIDAAFAAREEETMSLPPPPSRRRLPTPLVIGAFLALATGTAAALTIYVSRQEAAPSRESVEVPPSSRPRPRVAEVGPEAPADDVADETSTDDSTTSETPRRVRSGAVRAEPVDDLLERANRLRRERRFLDAERTYREVARVAPRTMSSYVAGIAAASIRLEQMNDPRGALALFETALRTHPGGALEIEALEGSARASSKLGRRARERDYLEQLIRDYPGSAAAERAAARLAAIEDAR